MDKSEKYIGMCEKSFKNVGYIPPTVGPNIMIPAANSIYHQKPRDLIYTYADKFENINLGSTIAPPVGQLYRQEQLQKMVGDYPTCLNRLDRMIEKGRPIWPDDYDSMEQLWLAFVMKEKFSKEWKNNKWTKIP